MAAIARAKTLPPFRVRYPRRMKFRKTYSVKVSWQSKPSRMSEEAPDISVRLVMAGAQVVPGERPMNPNRPNETATFYVTPLAKGWLRGERLEVLADGKKVQEISLPTKSVTQRMTLVLLLLAIVVPWWLITYIQKVPSSVERKLRFQLPWKRQVEFYTPVGWVRRESPQWLSAVGEENIKQLWKTIEDMYDVTYTTIVGDEWREMKPGGGGRQKGEGQPEGKGGGPAQAPPPVPPPGEDEVPPDGLPPGDDGGAAPGGGPAPPGGGPRGKVLPPGAQPPAGGFFGPIRGQEPDEEAAQEPEPKEKQQAKEQEQKKNGEPAGKKGGGKRGRGGKKGRGGFKGKKGKGGGPVPPGGGPPGGGMPPMGKAAPAGPAPSSDIPQAEGVYRLYFPFYVGLLFFILALISLWLHREKWKTRVGRPLQISVPDEE